MWHDLWSIVVLAGLCGWLVSVVSFAFRAFPARGEFDIRQARRWGSAVAIFFTVWVIGMLNA